MLRSMLQPTTGQIRKPDGRLAIVAASADPSKQEEPPGMVAQGSPFNKNGQGTQPV